MARGAYALERPLASIVPRPQGAPLLFPGDFADNGCFPIVRDGIAYAISPSSGDTRALPEGVADLGLWSGADIRMTIGALRTERAFFNGSWVYELVVARLHPARTEVVLRYQARGGEGGWSCRSVIGQGASARCAGCTPRNERCLHLHAALAAGALPVASDAIATEVETLSTPPSPRHGCMSLPLTRYGDCHVAAWCSDERTDEMTLDLDLPGGRTYPLARMLPSGREQWRCDQQDCPSGVCAHARILRRIRSS